MSETTTEMTQTPQALADRVVLLETALRTIETRLRTQTAPVVAALNAHCKGDGAVAQAWKAVYSSAIHAQVMLGASDEPASAAAEMYRIDPVPWPGSPWVPVAERLPAEGEFVLAARRGGPDPIGALVTRCVHRGDCNGAGQGEWACLEYEVPLAPDEVIWWLPIPPLPAPPGDAP